MEYLSAAQAAARAGVRPSTVSRWVASGQLQIAEGDLDAFLPLRDAAPRAMPADAAVALAVAQERIRGLEELVALEREWRTMAEERLALVQASLPAPSVQEQPSRPRRWFWPWGKGKARRQDRRPWTTWVNLGL